VQGNRHQGDLFPCTPFVPASSTAGLIKGPEKGGIHCSAVTVPFSLAATHRCHNRSGRPNYSATCRTPRGCREMILHSALGHPHLDSHYSNHSESEQLQIHPRSGVLHSPKGPSSRLNWQSGCHLDCVISNRSLSGAGST
jgi:hypothetical protein